MDKPRREKRGQATKSLKFQMEGKLMIYPRAYEGRGGVH